MCRFLGVIVRFHSTPDTVLEAGSQRIVIGDRIVLDDASTHLNALVC